LIPERGGDLFPTPRPNGPRIHPVSHGVRLQGHVPNLSILSRIVVNERLQLYFLDKSQWLHCFVSPHPYTVRVRSRTDSPVTFRRTFLITLNVRPVPSKVALGYICRPSRPLWTLSGRRGEADFSHCIVSSFQ
jgi:hypothetical protein